MRYRLQIVQVMDVWHATVTTWEPNGLKVEKHTDYYHYAVHPDYPDDLFIVLQQLCRALTGFQE